MVEESPQAIGPHTPVAPILTTEYESPQKALQAVRDSYQDWTGHLADTSLQLSYAIIAANWAVFGSVEKILKNPWSKWSVALVICGLGLSVAGAKWMGELLHSRIVYAETHAARWYDQFRETAGKQDPWPYTGKIDYLGRAMREARTWLPLAAGGLFLIALLHP